MSFSKCNRCATVWFPIVAVVGIAAAAAPQLKMSGFARPAAEQEKTVEQLLAAEISTDRISQFHRYLTAEPHPAGSKRNNDLAQWVSEKWKEQGLEDVATHEYDVLNSTPRSVSVELVSPVDFHASLREDRYPQDPDTKNPDVSSSYLGYSASGDVTAPVVYAHSGNPEDYAYLRAHGIDVRGKIVLVRYSNPYSYRGFKAITAQKLGAAALLIYSDPAEDGFTRGKVFPDGPWGPASHIQRGAITYDFIEPGDPTTPGWASVPGAKHISPEDAVSMPHIIAVPLSWRDAEPMLKNMGGPVAPKSWQGGLPFEYHLGGEQAQVHVKVDMDTSIQPYYDVEARITGSEHPDEWIVLGNHRDAWAFGGVDPSSGTASMLELTRDFGALLKKGIRPKRTLVFCDWDGEEYALTGSTEWGEQYADELKKNAIAYMNVDSSASGPDFHGSAVGSLAPLLVEVSRDVKAPSGHALYDEWRASRAKELDTPSVPDASLTDTRIGSGSDHTVFLNYLGIPTMLLQFDGPYGVYHSMYDDFYWMNHFGDPGYRYHAAMSDLWGALSLRLANSEILPYDFSFYADQIRQFARDLDASSHVSKHMSLASLYEHIDAFEAAAESLNEATSQSLASGHVDSAAAERLNQSLMQVERNWCDAAGIPGRPWFKHSVYAARYTYAHLELPGMTEAAEAGNWKVVGEQEQIIERELEKNTALLTHARADFMHKGVESAATPTAPQSNSPLNDDYAVYSAVIAHELKFIGGKLLVLENQTSTSSPERLALLTSGGGKESEEFNATVSAETLSDFGAKNKKPILLAPLLKLSLPYELRTNAELDVFFKKSGGGYPAFRKKFSGAQGIITLSRVGFNSGRNQALVYVGYNCGPLCGHGDLYLLTKLGTEWTIQKWTMLWIS